MELVLASYNIHSGIGTDGEFDLSRVAEVLKETGADLIALQEVGDFRGVTAHEEHPEDLARMLGMHMAYGPNVFRDGRRYGNAILSRHPIVNTRNYDLSVHRREPRGALRCDIDLGEARQLHLFCIHLGLSIGERRRQEALLLSADILRQTVRQDPVVICGDFNYWLNGPVPSLVRNEINDAAHLLQRSDRTYPSRRPLMRLDRMYVDAGIVPHSLTAHRSKLSAVASDHLPLVMRFGTRHPELRSSQHPAQIVA